MRAATAVNHAENVKVSVMKVRNIKDLTNAKVVILGKLIKIQ